MRTIPLHSLVVLIGTSKLREQEIITQFDENELLSKSDITKKIFGDENRYIHSDIINSELYRLINIKLSLGERVVLSNLNLSKNKRINYCNLGKKYGVPVYYVIHHNPSYFAEKSKIDTFLENESSILKGDGYANVIDLRIDNFNTVKKFPFTNLLDDLIKRGFNGITVAGDVHGNIESLKNSIDWSISRNHLYLQLGDIIDYGPNSIDCIRLVYDRIIRGKMLFVIGNHDRKLEKWFQQENNIKKNKDYYKFKSPIVLSDSNRKTIEEINNLSEIDRKIIEYKFNTIMNMGRYHYNIGDFSFAHAGINDEIISMNCDRLYGRLESICLYGNITENNNWIEGLETNRNIFVGHTIRNNLIPEKILTKNGGNVIFQDTGSSKGGNLTTTDIIIKNNVLEIQNSNRW